MKRDAVIYIALFLIVFGVYIQVHSFDFVKYDDDEFVVNNLHIREGFTAGALHWAFTSTYAANWFPLTWISYMLGYRLYGLDSGWHHLTNVALHTVSTLLLFGILRRMTGARWRSAFVAFAFALHPLHVEPVAWIAERKEVLSGLFWFLTIAAYLHYTKRPAIYSYLLVTILFAAGLMSKPMIVTLPFALFLLDMWPLNRLTTTPLYRLLMEKAPLLALSAAASIITFSAQKHGGAVSSLDLVPLAARLQNALVSYVIYAVKFVWPTGTAIVYPLRADFPVWQTAGAALALMAITALALLEFRRRPYVTVGWLWFLGTLVPVIGIVQVGIQSRADRYTYISYLGLSIIAAWGLAEIADRSKRARSAALALSVAACSAWLALTFLDIGYWRSSVAVFDRAIAVTSGNWVAQNGLAQGLLSEGRIDEAMKHSEESLRLNPNAAQSHVIFGDALNRRDRLDDAEAQFQMAIRLQPENADAQEGLGMALTDKGRMREALPHLMEAIRLRPNDPDSHYNLGRLYGLSNRPAEAAAQFAETVRLKPNDAAARYNLATALGMEGRVEEACAEFRAAIALRPDYTEAHLTLARLLASADQCAEAVVELREVLRLEPDSADARELLEQCSPAGR